MLKRMKDFADFYLESGNIYESAIKAGYSENYAKTNASKLLDKDSVKNYIDDKLAEIQSQRIATVTEVMEYLTKGLRQELEEEVVVTEGIGDGCSEARIIKKKIGVKDSNKCAEMLAKRFGILSDKLSVDGNIPIVISGDGELED
jgi:phage terminase small subunit